MALKSISFVPHRTLEEIQAIVLKRIEELTGLAPDMLDTLGKITELLESDSNLKQWVSDSRIITASVSEGGHLMLVRGDGSTLDAGSVIAEKGEKGDKGDKGEKGDNAPHPTDEHLLSLIEPLIPPSVAGHTPTEAELLALIGPLIPAPIKGDKGDAGANATVTSVATTTTNGLMSAEDKIKINKTSLFSFSATSNKTVGATSAETSLIPPGKGSLIIPSALFDAEGAVFEFEVAGKYTNTSSGLVSLRVKLGTQVTLSILNLSLPALTDKTWAAKGRGTVRANRALTSYALLNYDDDNTKLEGASFANSTITIAAGDKTADFTAQWATNTPTASITVEQLTLKYHPAP